MPGYPAGVGLRRQPDHGLRRQRQPAAGREPQRHRLDPGPAVHDLHLDQRQPARRRRAPQPERHRPGQRDDALRRRRPGHAVTDATGWSSQTTYTPDGLVTGTQEPAGAAPASAEHRTVAPFNAAGQPTVSVGVAGGTQGSAATVTSYYADGLTHEVNNPVTGHNAGNLRTRYAYDPAGNPTQVWSPNAVALASGNTAGLPTINTFAKSGALAAMVEPVVTATNLRRATRFTYDAAGRKLTQNVAEITGTDPYNPATVVRNAGTQSFTWSANGWSLSETGRGGEVITRSYLPNGLVASVTDVANQATVTNSWLLNGLLRTSTTAVSEAPAYATMTTAFKHHADGTQASQSIGTDVTGATACPDHGLHLQRRPGPLGGGGRPVGAGSSTCGASATTLPGGLRRCSTPAGGLTEYARNPDGTSSAGR